MWSNLEGASDAKLSRLDLVSGGFFKAVSNRIVIGGLDEGRQGQGWDSDWPWACDTGGWLAAEF